MAVDLTTNYLGLDLKNPLVVSSCPLTANIEHLRKLEQAGAAAAVLPSIFEEQIEHDAEEMVKVHEFGTESFAEALTYFPEEEDSRPEPTEYLETIAKAKKAVQIPIIASVNATNNGGWVRYAKMMEDAGADAVELNIYCVPADLNLTGQDVENRYFELVSEVRQSISIPLAVKLGPHYTSPGNVAKRFVESGADGLVMFNRLIQPDIDLEHMEAATKIHFSSSDELALSLRWIALLYGRVNASLAATGGIHDATDLIKVLLAGANVGLIASVLYQRGVDQIGTILSGVESWMTANDYTSVKQLLGSMSRERCPNATVFQSGNYMKTLTSFVGKAI